MCVAVFSWLDYVAMYHAKDRMKVALCINVCVYNNCLYFMHVTMLL